MTPKEMAASVVHVTKDGRMAFHHTLREPFFGAGPCTTSCECMSGEVCFSIQRAVEKVIEEAVSQEREQCAKIADDVADTHAPLDEDDGGTALQCVAIDIAKRIRGI